MAPAIFWHRITPNFAAQSEGVNADDITKKILATIPKDKEDAFNRWYNEEHVPQVLQWKGVVSARRYRAILGEDPELGALRQFLLERTEGNPFFADEIVRLLRHFNLPSVAAPRPIRKHVELSFG